LLAPAESSDIAQRSLNLPLPPLPPRFGDIVAKDGDVNNSVIDTGDVTADRADVEVIAGIPAYAGAVASVEVGRTCNEGDASAPKDWDCDPRRPFRGHRLMFCAHVAVDR